ncbi:MAG: helix-turn-helix domain-containing protein [Victivallaceae bacterium]|nr:helix-turn-helix domain-containing protein [Victivallaceae bacterium]
MKNTTLTTIQTLLQVDPEVQETQAQTILKACRIENKRRDLILPKEAAKILGCCRVTLRRHQQRGLLNPIYYSQRKIRFDRDEVINLLHNGIKLTGE